MRGPLLLFESIDYVGNAAHFLAVDRTGDSIVGGWLEDGLKPIRKKDKQVITNYLLSNPKLGGFPCRRYETAAAMLKTLSDVRDSKDDIGFRKGEQYGA